MVVAVAQDFRLTSSTPSQTVTGGQTSGAYNLTVQPVGASFSGAVTLTCSAGMPAGALCIFNPRTAVTPDNPAVDVVMNISTKAAQLRLYSRTSRASIVLAVGLLLPGIVLAWGSAGRRSGRPAARVIGAMAALLLLSLLLACSGVSHSRGSGGSGGNQPVTYQITVTGTPSGTTPDAGPSVKVTLLVK